MTIAAIRRPALAAALSLVTSLALATAAQAADVIWQAKGDGRSAEAQFSEDGGGGGRINVFQNGNSAFLFYEIWGNDPTSESCSTFVDEFGRLVTACRFTRNLHDSGWGEIPATDILFSATGATLTTTTGAGFTSNRCTTDFSTPTPATSCVPAGPVSLDLEWTSQLGGTVCTSIDSAPYTCEPGPTAAPAVSSSLNTAGVSQHAIDSFRFQNLTAVRGDTAFAHGTALGRELRSAPSRLSVTKGKNVATD